MMLHPKFGKNVKSSCDRQHFYVKSPPWTEKQHKLKRLKGPQVDHLRNMSDMIIYTKLRPLGAGPFITPGTLFAQT